MKILLRMSSAGILFTAMSTTSFAQLANKIQKDLGWSDLDFLTSVALLKMAEELRAVNLSQIFPGKKRRTAGANTILDRKKNGR